MARVRAAAVAGMFYPAEHRVLQQVINQYLHQAEYESHGPVKALVVPHAGYIYSGPVAATAYKQLLPYKNEIKKVVVFGPSHRVAFHGLAVPEADIFTTPLGDIRVDAFMLNKVADLPQVIISDQPHAQEHSVEVQLPFLQQVLDDFTLLPIVVGEADAADVAEVIEHLWNDETLFVISTDLSHYHAYQDARQRDASTSEAIEQLKPEMIGYEDACGRNGLNGMLAFARQHHLQVDLLDLRNSGDTAGDKSRVVGYGAYVIH